MGKALGPIPSTAGGGGEGDQFSKVKLDLRVSVINKQTLLARSR
jgi:hypothetical protein